MAGKEVTSERCHKLLQFVAFELADLAQVMRLFLSKCFESEGTLQIMAQENIEVQ